MARHSLPQKPFGQYQESEPQTGTKHAWNYCTRFVISADQIWPRTQLLWQCLFAFSASQIWFWLVFVFSANQICLTITDTWYSQQSQKLASSQMSWFSVPTKIIMASGDERWKEWKWIERLIFSSSELSWKNCQKLALHAKIHLISSSFAGALCVWVTTPLKYYSETMKTVNTRIISGTLCWERKRLRHKMNKLHVVMVIILVFLVCVFFLWFNHA